MHLYRMGTLALFMACLLAGCSRPQPAATPTPPPPENPPTAPAIQPAPAVYDEKQEAARIVKQDARIDAVMEMMLLGNAAYKYKKDHGEFPKSLGLIVASENDLRDPWGRSYHYDPKGTHNSKRGLPDIWSDGADPKDPHAVLANWDDGAE